MVRQLAALRAEDAALVEDVRRALVDSLYAPFASLVVGAFSGAIIATTAALWSADLDPTLLAIALGLDGAARIGFGADGERGARCRCGHEMVTFNFG